jgi:hypothetical protein
MDIFSVWLDQLLIELGRCEPQGQAALHFLKVRGVKVSFHEQPTAARWTLAGNIQLHPKYATGAPDAPYPLSLIVHEVRHLQQGIFTALSVYGELEAWQVQFSFLQSLTGQYHSNIKFNAIINDLMTLKLKEDRKILTRAISLMKAYAGKGYRVNILPLYPLPREILFLFTRN